ncbi:sulfur carrier protein ThiS adenylyltransferase ThiF [Desulfogranum marinum]|uniref:sulfur carrier protein ThiS adenylyltransferase ThiF n=1 Tax=Desulfogranum marinum TaxID=453220 RepID=UPI0029C732AE|nr:sulfur carrier protein ThiS adenylyltransferase ThiF [Desulfogranum marinum]
MKIGIAGAGGIGSNVAVNLVRSGITALKIIDFDRVESSNLDRQFYFADQVGKMKVDMLRYNLMRINPDVEIEISTERITPSNIDQLFIHCDTIVEGLDKKTDKKLVLEHFGQSKRLVISASGIAGSDIATIQVKKIGNTHVVGDFITDCCHATLYAHKVITVAAGMTAVLLSSWKRQ